MRQSMKTPNRYGLTALWLVLAVSLPVAAQPTDMGGYNAMRIDSVGMLEGGFDGTIQRMTDGVSITLIADDPELQNLPIRAGRMDFTWPAGASTPTVIIMEGNVQIDHPQASVTAQRAEWDFEQGELTFTGNPVMRSEQVKEMRGERMVLNFEKNSFQVSGARVSELPLRSPGGGGTGDAPSNPELLQSADIADWSGLISAMKSEAGADGATPGKQILGFLGTSERSQFDQAPVELLLQNQGMVLQAINQALQQGSFFSAEAWADSSMPEEARTLLDQSERSAEETARMNRLLLQAAYPQYISSR